MKQLALIKRSNGDHWVGDGFPVRNIFSYSDIAADISPFLLMDYAGPAHFPPTERKLGVGQHPHRGFETVTIVYEGGVSHRDSAGGGGTIGPGDVQWMTAGAGLVHEEYHSPEFAKAGGPFEMIQLWVNLPAHAKMSPPAYQSIARTQIPVIKLPDDAGQARVIAGHLSGHTGPARTFTPMNVWDLQLNAGRRVTFELTEGHTLAVFVLKGAVQVSSQQTVREAELAVMEQSGRLLMMDVEQDTAALLLAGAPLNEPIVGHGPFVMNTHAEIREAIEDFRNGRFGRIRAGA